MIRLDRSRLARLARWGIACVLAAAVAGALAIGGMYLYLAPGLPAVARLQDVQLQEPLRIHAANGDLMALYGTKLRIPVELSAVPQPLRDAVIAAEDNRFYAHPGVDWMGIVRAAWNLALTGEKSQGGSTITMQLARNFFLTREKTYVRKIREIFLALRISHELSKRRVLELYLNKIYLGRGAYGVAAAARRYYGKSLQALAVDEMATIAGLPRAPSYLNPIDHPERARRRRNYVLRQMRDNGMITRSRYEEVLAQPVTASAHGPPIALEAPYAAAMARLEARRRLGDDVGTRGRHVYTTIVPREQRAATGAVRAGLLAYTRRHGYRGPVGRVDGARLPEVDELRAQLTVGTPGDAPRLPTRDPGRGVLEAGIVDPGTLSPRGLDALLARHAGPADLRAAVVLAVDASGADVYCRAGGIRRLAWAGMRWAAPRRPDGGVGSRPDAPGDVVSRGDVVHVHTGDQGGLRLGQVPGPQAALVAIDPHDGGIRAVVGGFDFDTSAFNRATRARRQAGSSFKPFIYSAALSRGYTAATLVNDAPIVFRSSALEDTWRPENYSGRVFGPTRLREGLVHSRNLVTLRVLRDIGVPYARDYARRFGFPEQRLPRNLTLALGSASVSPLELARGYAVFANMGYRVRPHLLTRIASRDGRVIYRAHPATACDEPCAAQGGRARRSAPRVIEAQNAYLVRSFLRDVARRGTGRGTRVLGRDDLAGKTGTTDRQRDAWFAGFNSAVVATAWVGYDGLRSLGPGETGARVALPVWVDFMEVALADTPVQWPARPPGMVSVRIDPDTGDYARPGPGDAVFELFRAGNAPEAGSRDRREAPGHLF